jgi:hypothetical protein
MANVANRGERDRSKVRDRDHGDDSDRPQRGRLLDPIDRISEVLFGLVMAVTIVGSLSIAGAGRAEVRTVLIGAVGCNLAWGLVDAVMYLVRTLTERTRNRTLVERILRADPRSAQALIREALPPGIAAISGPDDVEGIRRRLQELPLDAGAALRRDDWMAALAIFLLVVLATFPVVVPFMLTNDLALAMNVSRAVTLVMLFGAGFALGRHAWHHRPWVAGLSAALLGAVLIVAVMALGG